MILRVKPGVQPRLVYLLAAVSNAGQKAGLEEIWITSAMDSIHGTDSLHYALRAIDLRTHNLTPDEITRLMACLKDDLGEQIDVLWEHRGTPNAHLHIEWDPH